LSRFSLACLHRRYHYQHEPGLEHWLAQATTTSRHRRGPWWHPSRSDIPLSSYTVSILLLTPHPGPTAFGRIPGFTEHIFPSQSLPYLSLVANIGLTLFLFIMGLEINPDRHPTPHTSLPHRRRRRDHTSVRLGSFAFHFPLSSIHRYVPSVVHEFHALHWRRVLDHGFALIVPHSHGAQPVRHVCWGSGVSGWRL
jgi:hypothetical protein